MVFADGVSRFRTLSLSEVPDDAQTVARQCLLDWLGCAIAGSAEPLSEILQSTRILGRTTVQIVLAFSAIAIVLAMFAARLVTRVFAIP